METLSAAGEVEKVGGGQVGVELSRGGEGSKSPQSKLKIDHLKTTERISSLCMELHVDVVQI